MRQEWEQLAERSQRFQRLLRQLWATAEELDGLRLTIAYRRRTDNAHMRQVLLAAGRPQERSTGVTCRVPQRRRARPPLRRIK